MRRNPSGDSVAAHELALYAVNNAELYRSRTVPVIANLKKKIKKGVYDPQLALKLWRYVADDAAKRYTFEFDATERRAGSPYRVKGYGIFTVPIRVEAAREIAAHYSEELNDRVIRGGPFYPDVGRNPARRIRSTRRAPSKHPGMLAAQRKVGRTLLHSSAPYHTQVRRGKSWVTLGAFFTKVLAADYGRALAHRYPRQQFRVFWPDEKKNPAAKYHTCPVCEANFRLIGGKFPQHKFLGKLCPGSGTQPGDYSGNPRRRRELSPPERHQLKIARDSLKMPDAMLGVMGGPTKAQAREIIRRLTRKKNPAPRDSVRGGAKVDAAARLYSQFTGHKVGRARQVKLPAHAAGLAIGPVLGVAYETTRDGKREKYLHDFRRGARPTLAASFDGRQLYLLGGAYRFTERGIVDR